MHDMTPLSSRITAILEQARSYPPIKVAVVDAQEIHVLAGVVEASDYGLIEPILLGPRTKIDVPPPNGESLEMTAARTLPYYRETIVPHLQNNETVLISAHGNSLRSIIMNIEQMTPQQIIDYELATGTFHMYTFDEELYLLGKRICTNPCEDV